MDQTKLDRFYIVVFTALCLLLRLLYINHSEVAVDEPFSIGVAQLPLNEIPQFLSYYNNPPLFELLLHGVVKWFGVETPWVRLISTFASAITVVFIYLIGSRFFNRRVAVSASFLYTFATFQIGFAHEARVYALFHLLTCASMFLLLTINQQQKTKWVTIICFALVNILLVFSHYFGWIVWALQLSWLIAIGRTKRNNWPIGLAMLMALVAYIPQIEIMIMRFGDASQTHWVAQPSVEDLYYNLMKMLNAPVVAFTAIVIGLLAAGKAILRKQYLMTPDHTLLLLHWFVSAYFGMFLVSMVVPVFLDRYLIFVSGALYLLLAIGIDSLLPEDRSWPLHGLLGMLFLLSVNLKPDNGRRWMSLVEQVDAQQSPRTCVVIVPEWTSIQYAYSANKSWFKDFHNIHSTLTNHRYYPINKLEEYKQLGIDTLYDRVILIDAGSEFVDPNRLLLNHLKQQYKRTRIQKPFNGVLVQVFEK